MKISRDDKTIDNLLMLDGVSYIIHEQLGVWVKFEVKRIPPNNNRPHGIKYTFTLHDRTNARIMGFDNAHAIEYGKKTNVASKKIYDHWHRDKHDVGKPYHYRNAGKLLEDFWEAVDKIVSKLEEKNNE